MGAKSEVAVSVKRGEDRLLILVEDGQGFRSSGSRKFWNADADSMKSPGTGLDWISRRTSPDSTEVQSGCVGAARTVNHFELPAAD